MGFLLLHAVAEQKNSTDICNTKIFLHSQTEHVKAAPNTNDSESTTSATTNDEGSTTVTHSAADSGINISTYCSTAGDGTHDDGSSDTDTTLILPACWTHQQYHHFKSRYDWLFLNAGKLGCIVCKMTGCLGPAKQYGMHTYLSEEWISGNVGLNGKTKSTQQSSLRKKLYEHSNSAGHKSAVVVQEDKSKETLKHSLAHQGAEQLKETCSVFRTAYYIAKTDKPYSDHPELIDLQSSNGINMGRILHSRTTCTDIISHISVQMKHLLIKKIIDSKSLLSVLIDESTSLAKDSCLIVFIRTTLNENVGPVTFFLDLVSLPATTSEAIESALLSCLNGHGLTHEILSDCWIGLGIDGASVMLGSKSGVATRLISKFPFILSWHCFNHRLELSVNDAIKACTEINHFKVFMDTLYATYSVSPKSQRELAECAKELEVSLNRIGRVLDIRWVASSCRTVKAVWQSYTALHAHFSKKACDSSVEGHERSKFSGMAKKLENPIFIKNIALMYDALEELGDLSLALQKSDVNLPTAHRLISRQVEVFKSRRDSDSPFYSEACRAITEGVFKQVTIGMASGKEKEINRGQFYQALSDSMTARMLPESEKIVYNATEILDSSLWPSDLSADYGENNIRILCLKFRMEFSEVKSAFRDWKERGAYPSIQPALIKQLVNRINTIPVSTAVCERGFSKMNLVCSALRTRLSVFNLSSLLFISICGPPVKLWQPLPYVKTWLNQNRREATCTQGPCRDTDEVFDEEMTTLWETF